MQGHQYPPLHQDCYHTTHVIQPSIPVDHRLANTQNGVHHGSFSGGSSLTYRYFPDRGDPPSSLPSSSLAATSLGATGMAITGHSTSGIANFRPEEIVDYEQPWQWTAPTVHGVPSQVADAPDINFLAIKSTRGQETTVRSPAAQLPTPAAMAVLLNPTTRSVIPTPAISFPPPAQILGQAAAAATPRSMRTTETQSHGDSSLSREKKHACTMCYKRSAKILGSLKQTDRSTDRSISNQV